MLYRFREQTPTSNRDGGVWDGWIAPSATVLGQVHLGAQVSVWFGAVIRGDTSQIIIGDMSNIQDNAVLHADSDAPLTVGHYVTVGHQATLHGCTIGDNTLIGIGAVVLNGAVIGKNCIIGSHALIAENKIIPEGSIVMGAPGKVVKQMTTGQIHKNTLSALHYAQHCQHYKTQLHELEMPIRGMLQNQRQDSLVTKLARHVMRVAKS